jgi:pimeloyl-ACP methyl ester carboxylesterase
MASDLPDDVHAAEPVHRIRRVASHGVTLSVREHGVARPAGPHLVLVHGYPDNQVMWEPLVHELLTLEPALHVVTYDVRGAGASDVPAGVADYRTELLVEDLAAVVEATVPPGEPVHLVGHDWGSVQLWDAVAEPHHPALKGRIASFTSLSGPSLDHMAHLSRHPGGRRLRLARQLGHSWYVYLFHVPVVPELLWRGLGGRLGRLAAAREPGHVEAHWGPELGRDATNGLNLYRANVVRRMRRPRPLHTEVPVQVVAPTGDPYLTGVILEDLDLFCTDVSLARPEAGHWVARSHPGLVAGLVLEHVRAHC